VPCCSAADCFLRAHSRSTGGRTDHLGHFIFEFSWCEAVSSLHVLFPVFYTMTNTKCYRNVIWSLKHIYNIYTDLYLSTFSWFLEIRHMRIAMKTIRPSVGTLPKLPKQANN
jgi:hypothetical protein